MSEMGQIIGNAILTVMVEECDETLYACGVMSDKTIAKIVQSALGAMRDPTLAMLDTSGLPTLAAQAVWQSMIDEAMR